MTLAVAQANVTSGVCYSSGSRTGTRTAADFTITLGFSPKYIKITNLTDRISAEWYAENGNATQLKTVAAGTRTLEACGISVSVADGLATVSVDVSVANVETDNDVTVWEAWG